MKETKTLQSIRYYDAYPGGTLHLLNSGIDTVINHNCMLTASYGTWIWHTPESLSAKGKTCQN